MKRIKKKIVVLVIGLLVCLTMSACGKKEINLNDYVKMEYSGYDGYGTVKVVFDTDAMEEDCKKIKITNDDVAFLCNSPVDYYLDFCVNYTLSDRTELSNGDKITLKWDVEDGMVSNNTTGMLTYSDMSFTVSDLEVMPTVDISEIISIEYEGLSPDAKAKITGDEFNLFTFADDESMKNSIEPVKNGDVLKVYMRQKGAGKSAVDKFIETYGGVPAGQEIEFVVSGLGAYVAKVDEVPASTLNDLEADAHQYLLDYIETQYGSEDFCEVTLIQKRAGISDTRNRVGFVYSITHPDGFDYYWCILYPEIILEADGTATYDVEMRQYPQGAYHYGIATGSCFVKNGAPHIGFETLEEMEKSLKETKIDDWDIVSQ